MSQRSLDDKPIETSDAPAAAPPDDARATPKDIAVTAAILLATFVPQVKG
jgi:hypothetical protein